ncbi:MAG: DUF748 domain-containing protein, partial [Sediminibacterium sp.]|nr:DUF748 domain-containing protein [Sediminibacterium sp.]
MFNWKRILLFIFSSLVALVILAAIFISPIAKYLIEKYSEQYTGRLINMNYLRINLFNGEVNLKGLRIYEKERKGIFVSVGEIDARVSLIKMIYSNYLIKKLHIKSPVIRIAQKGNRFNYDDLIKRFLEEEKPAKQPAAPTQYWVKQFQIENATLIYTNSKPAVTLQLVNTRADIADLAWNNPLYHVAIDTRLQSGGDAKGVLDFNSNTLQYHVSADVNRFSIGWMYPYLKDYMKVRELRGVVGGKFQLTGNGNRPLDIALSGTLGAEKFAIVDESGELLTAAEQMAVKIDTIHTAKNRYDFAYINMSKPFIRLTMYDKGFNYERIFTTPSAVSGDTSQLVYSNIFLMMAGYIQDLVKQYDENEYKVNRLSIAGGQCIFTDYTHG